MRKQSRAEVEKQLDQVRRERDILDIILAAIENGEKPVIEKAREDQERTYTFKLYRATSAHGGVVSCSYVWKDQRPLVTVDYLDHMSYPTFDEFLPLNIAIERLRVARQRLLDQKAA